MAHAAQEDRRAAKGKLELILRHAAQEFAEKGYEGASIRDISRSSGVSLSGLYYYIESKQNLLYQIQIHTFRTILERLQKRLRAASSPVERLRILVSNHLDYFLQHPLEMKVLAHEDDALEGEYRKEVAEIKRRYYGLAVGIFEDLRRSGSARRLNPRVAVLSLFGMMNWIHTWHRSQVDPGAGTLSEAMAEMFLHGVMNGHRNGAGKIVRGRRRRVRQAAEAAR